jgi:tryptophanyl-tRNA synthetase
VHLGHYFGAVQHHLKLQHEYPGEAFYVIADYHYLVRGREPSTVHEATIELAASYLALGLDPNKAILYRQSDVPQIFELYWTISCMTSAATFASDPSFKDADEDRRTLGMLAGPILMAADILGLRATTIPVGMDQADNVARIRSIAERFHQFYGTQLPPVPRPIYADVASVPGTDGRRMNHSNGNVIGVFDRFATLSSRVKSIATNGHGAHESKDPDACPVFALYALCASPDDVASMREAYESGSISYDDAKRQLSLALAEYFEPAVERYHDLKQRTDYLNDIVRLGHRLAAEEINITIEAVRGLAGFDS